MANNRSFETAGLVQGTADLWAVLTRYSHEGIAIFNKVYSGPTLIAWSPAELFELNWWLPFCVHESQDAAHTISTPDASIGGGWLSVYNLLEEINADLRGHAETAGKVHRQADSMLAYYASFFSRPTNATEAQNNAEWIRTILYAEDWNSVATGHLSAWPAVHRREDIFNRITGSTAVDLATTVDLVNEIKIKLNTHLALTRYGDDNSHSTLYLNDVSHVDLPVRQAGLVRDLPFENFERGWSIPGLATSGKISDQEDLVSMDSPGGGSLWGSLVWGVGMWGAGSVSWPGGHEQFLYSWGLIRAQPSVPPAEIFEKGWKLPGAIASSTNDLFKARYYDATHVDDLIVLNMPATKILSFAATSTAKARISVRDGSFLPSHIWTTLRIEGASQNVGDHAVCKVLSSTDVEVITKTIKDEVATAADVQLRQSQSPWRFNELTQLQTGIVETFNSGWRDCEVGAARYWSGSEWRFLPTQIYVSNFGVYELAHDDLSTGDWYYAPALADFSHWCCLRVATAFGDKGQFWTEFVDGDGVTQSCYWFVDLDDLAEGTVITDIGLTSIEADPRYQFDQHFRGIKEVLNVSHNFALPVGRGEWFAAASVAETFESGWTLTLTI